jgi:Family of unknown function (DUF6065)
MRLIAYYRGSKPAMRIVPASRWRDWMNATVKRNANRCLPLLVANEVGWFLLNERPFTATWSGGETIYDVEIAYAGAKPALPASSNFGSGILTFRIPYLFRTPPGWDLHVRGPTNLPRDGIAPLDGIVETDWALATFTMNWKFTRPGSVVFDAGDPFCMVIPHRRHDVERFEPELRPAEEDVDVARGWEAFGQSRLDIGVKKFLAEFTNAHADSREAWEGDYFRGKTTEGAAAPEHVTRRRLKPFDAEEED